MKWQLWLIFVCFLTFSKGQERIEEYLENWMILEEEPESEREFTDVYQAYQSIDFSLTDFYKLEKWYAFFFLNDNEIKQIRNHLENYTNETSIAFLNILQGFPKEKAYLIRYKIMEESVAFNQYRTLDYSLDTYIRIPTLDEINVFKNRTRIQVNRNTFRMFLQSEKDQHETSGIDYLSGGFTFKQKNSIFYLGDYTVKFGLGMSLYQGYQNPITSQNTINENRIKLHTGTDESRYLRGVAVEVNSSKQQKIMGFLSFNQVDGQLNAHGISKLYSSGNHVSDSELENRKSINLHHLGVGYTLVKTAISFSSLCYMVRFNQPMLNIYDTLKTQISNAYSLTYFNSRIHVSTEINLDQFKYGSYLSMLRLHLGQALYFRSYLGKEHNGFINHFNKISKSFSNPEQFYGYRLESIKKKTQIYFEYQNNRELPSVYTQKRRYRLGVAIHLKNKSILQFRSSLKEGINEKGTELQNTKIFRGRLSFISNKRGLWNWKQSIYFKSGTDSENGFAFAMQFEYKKAKHILKLGCILSQQNNGAFYIYETDVLSSGYVKGIFNTKNIFYITSQINLRKLVCYNKLRVEHYNKVSFVGWTIGIKYNFE